MKVYDYVMIIFSVTVTLFLGAFVLFESSLEEVPQNFISEIKVAETDIVEDEIVCMEETIEEPEVEQNIDLLCNESQLMNWIASWENQWLYEYQKNSSLAPEYNKVAPYITEDGKFYKCKKDLYDGTLNYGYGICIYADWFEGKWLNANYFNEYGVDITQSTEGSLLPIELVNRVHRDIIESIKIQVRDKVNECGVSMSENQIDALTGVAYQFGVKGANIESLCQLYKVYGNDPVIKEQYQTIGGNHPFEKIPGGCNMMSQTRAEANWALFSEGTYIYG